MCLTATFPYKAGDEGVFACLFCSKQSTRKAGAEISPALLQCVMWLIPGIRCGLGRKMLKEMQHNDIRQDSERFLLTRLCARSIYHKK